MTRLVKWILVPLFFLTPFLTKGEATDSVHIQARARELALKGLRLNDEGSYYQALDTFKLFLEYRKKLFSVPHSSLGSPYMFIGVAHKNLGQYKPALENFEASRLNFLSGKDKHTPSLARLYLNLGNVYRGKLDYKNAIAYFEQALSIFSNQVPIDAYDISDAYYSIAEIYYLQNNYENASKVLLDNLNQANGLLQIYYYELLALVYQNLEKKDIALKYFREAMKVSEQFFDESDIGLGMICMNYAEFLFSTNNYNESLQILQRAYNNIIVSQPTRGEQLSRYYELLGGFAQDKTIKTQQINRFRTEKKANLNEAIKWYTKGLNALSSSINDINIDSVRIEDCISFMDCLVLLQQIGDAYYELALIDKEDRSNFNKNSLGKALGYYNAASQLTQQARREISSDESKIQLAELEYYTFSHTIEIAYLAYELTGESKYIELAFHNSEQLKSSAIFDKISDDIAQENSLIPDSLLQHQNKLNGLISIYNQKIFEESSYEDADSILIDEYRNIIFEASRERDELNRYLEEEYSDYYDLKYSSSMLSIADIQKKLTEDEAIFEYVIIEPDIEQNRKNESETSSLLYTFLITQAKTLFYKSSISKKLDSSLEDVFNFMSNPAYLLTTNEDSKEFCVSSHQLYLQLIKPYEKELSNKDLIIIPDGKLNYISFDGLLKTLPDTSTIINFSKLDYLVKDFNINYANSANILFKNRKNTQKIKNRVLAFAPEYDSEEFKISGETYTLMPLPGVQKEVDAISKTIKTKIYRRNDATEHNFREQAKDFDILHLAMHAYINDSLPAFSRLAFSPTLEDKELNTDGWLNTTDIYNLDLNARMAVLSACNTGVGKLQKGEGMMSLARGFLFAGCPSIIMSLWEVEDDSGTKIMTSFYKNLKKGKSKDEALRMAKLSYLENSNSRLAHPHYWMSFKSIGDNSPIFTSYDIYFFALLIILILAFTIDQLLRLKKTRRIRMKL